MDKTTLISVRVSEESLKVIDDYCKDSTWMKRSNVINSAIDFMAWAIKNGHGETIRRFYPKWDEVDKFDFLYHRIPR